MQREKLLRCLPKPVVDWLRLFRAGWLPKEYEPELSAVIRQLVQPGWVCVDVGANIGIVSCLLAKRITVENMVISDGIQRELVLYPARGGAGEEWNILGHDLEGNRTEAVLRIPATSLDAYFPPGSPVHFVK